MTALNADLDRWLRAGAGGAAPCERRIETSISWVYLYPDRALKLKRPVDFGFVDFTTLEKRRVAVERELDFNRVTAPDIYRGARAVVRRGDSFALDGPGEVVEWALEMRRFDERCVLSERPDAVTGERAETLGREIARFHADAPVSRRFGGAEGLRASMQTNAANLCELAAELDAASVETVIAMTQQAWSAAAPLLDARRAAGLVRRCHGDLHLGNILLEDGRTVLFDCIEFNDALSEIDVLYDLAFLLMDLEARDRPAAANRVMNGWLDEAARRLGPEVWSGLAALPLFQSVRAAIRAHVSAHAGNCEQGRRYLAAAAAHLTPARPSLVAIGGLSGSGKTTVARRLAPLIGARPGAVVVRSDEVRKRQWGGAPTERLPPEAYSLDAGKRVYAEMIGLAEVCLGAGRAVVLDAVFLRAEEREAAEVLARRMGVPFDGVWLEAPPHVLQARIASRRGDASDADAAVLAEQLTRDPGQVAWSRGEGGDAEATARAVTARLAG